MCPVCRLLHLLPETRRPAMTCEKSDNMPPKFTSSLAKFCRGKSTVIQRRKVFRQQTTTWELYIYCHTQQVPV